jgi:hypothetical protein
MLRTVPRHEVVGDCSRSGGRRACASSDPVVGSPPHKPFPALPVAPAASTVPLAGGGSDDGPEHGKGRAGGRTPTGGGFVITVTFGPGRAAAAWLVVGPEVTRATADVAMPAPGTIGSPYALVALSTAMRFIMLLVPAKYGRFSQRPADRGKCQCRAPAL